MYMTPIRLWSTRGEPLVPEIAPEPEIGQRADDARRRRAPPPRRSRPGSARAAAAPASVSRPKRKLVSVICSVAIGVSPRSEGFVGPARGGRRGRAEDGVRPVRLRSTAPACRRRCTWTARRRRRSPACSPAGGCSASRPGRRRHAPSSGAISSLHMLPSSTQRLTIRRKRSGSTSPKCIGGTSSLGAARSMYSAPPEHAAAAAHVGHPAGRSRCRSTAWKRNASWRSRRRCNSPRSPGIRRGSSSPRAAATPCPAWRRSSRPAPARRRRSSRSARSAGSGSAGRPAPPSR